MEQTKSKKKGIIIGVVVSLLLIVTIGITYAYWRYSSTTGNQVIVAGDIYMKYNETSDGITLENAMPSKGPDETKHFDFTIEGRNKYSKPIWYEIVLSRGEEDSSKTRLKDEFLRFRLVEINGEERKVVLDNASYSDLVTGKRIWVNTIDANTPNVEIKYELYMWIGFETRIGNTEGNDYTMDEWKDVYASVKVSVNGDFNEKKLPQKATDEIKGKVVSDVTDTCNDFTEKGGLVAINTEGTLYQGSEGEEIREYRYVGPDVDNYVYFNCEDNKEPSKETCELWRILGLFKDENGQEHIKIVRNETLKGEMMPLTFTAENGTKYEIRDSSNSDNAYWNNKKITNYNDWSTAGLQYWLNAGSDKDTKSPDDGYMSYLSQNAKSMIENTQYYLGNFKYNDTLMNNYTYERGNTSCSGSCSGGDVWDGNQAIWSGKIALMYPSDFRYTSNSCTWKRPLNDASNKNAINWLQLSANHNSNEWLLSPSSDYSGSAAYWYSSGAITNNGVSSNAFGARPTLNLKSQTKILSGEGNVDSPFVVELGDLVTDSVEFTQY